MGVHIGKIIKKEVNSEKIKITEFAEMISCSRRNVYEIFERESIDTNLLLRISKVLKKNLFLHYLTEDDLKKLKTPETNEEKLSKLIKDMKNQIGRLKKLT